MAGVEKRRTSSRPFGQGNYNLELFKPSLEGPHYKFTLLLPVTEKITGEKEEKAVFTSKDLEKLGELFNMDFGGATYLETKGAPPRKAPSVRGDWMDSNKNKVVVNWHARIEVYTRQHTDAIAYFTELKARLLLHAERVRQMRQDEIVIERIDVDFVPKTTLEALRTEAKQRLKYLKR